MDTDAVLQEALRYAKYGWRVLPLRPRDKKPRLDAWQKNASSDEATIEGWWEKWPDSNLGVQLGPASGIIDIECDSVEAEHTLSALFDGDFPITPTFQAHRGKHRLFKWRGDLPEPGKSNFKIGQLEFRTGNGDKGAQSVFPPSFHPTGPQYKWLVDPDQANIAEIPDSLIAKLWNAGGEDLFSKPQGGYEDRPPSVRHKLYNQAAVAEGVDGRDNTLHAESCAMWRERYLAYGEEIFDSAEHQSVIYQRLWAWNKAKCKPPLDDNDIVRLCDGGRKYIRSQSSNERRATGASLTAMGLELRDDGVEPGEWRLVIVESRPRTYKVFAPLFIHPPGYVLLNSDQMISGSAIRKAALEQQDILLDNGFRNLWEGTKKSPGLAARLIELAEKVPAPLEDQRDLVIAEMLYEELSKAKVVDDDTYPDRMGRPSKLSDGSVVFKFGFIWEPMARGDHRVKSEELSAILKQIGAEDKQYGPSSSRRRLKRLTATQIRILEKLIDTNVRGHHASESREHEHAPIEEK